jgi:hypothetical protein
MAQQVLLGLSPLHHCVLPAPETAGLCPSSFKPAVGKLLQLKLLSRPVLDAFQHQPQTDTTTTTIAATSSSSSSGVGMTHLWWHIGLRRWHLINQLQQQQQQKQQPEAFWYSAAAAAAAAPLTEQQLEDLYCNPDAR